MKTKIYPRCMQDMKQVYISADGLVMKCCWFGNKPYVDELYSFYDSDELKKLNVNEYALDDILKTGLLEKIDKSWESEKPLSTCLELCSQPCLELDGIKKEGKNNQAALKLKF